MRLLFSVFLFLAAFNVFSQADTSAWKVLEHQQKWATKRIERYLEHDTIINTGAARIHLYYSNKPGKPYLLLLHGMGMNGKTNWGKQIPALSKQFNLIVPDLVYFGESTSASNDFSPDFQAKQVHEAVGMLHLTSRLSVMGFSYGGLVTALYNAFYSTEINKLVIIDAPLQFYSLAMADSMAKASRVSSINALVLPANAQEFKAMQAAVISKHFPVPSSIRDKIIYHIFTKGKDVREKQLGYLASHELYYQSMDYHLDRAAVLFIWGKKDGLIPWTVGEKLHEAYPASQFLLIKKARHDAPFNTSKTVNRAVVKFLKEPEIKKP